jgi:hypothetical protein
MRVIALKQFTDAEGEDHPYGHEFDMPEGAELDALRADGTVRIDDRSAVPPRPAKAKKK